MKSMKKKLRKERLLPLVCQKAMESPGETLKRSRSDSEESAEENPRKRRSKCSEAIEYLQGKYEPYLELKRTARN